MDCDGGCMHVCSVVSDFLWPHGLWPPGSSVHEIIQARILEWVAISFSRGSSQPKDQSPSPVSPALAGTFFTTEPPEMIVSVDFYNWNGKLYVNYVSIKLLQTQKEKNYLKITWIL